MDDEPSKLSKTAQKRLRRKNNRLNRNSEVTKTIIEIKEPVSVSKYNSKEKRKLLRKLKFSSSHKEANVEETIMDTNIENILPDIRHIETVNTEKIIDIVTENKIEMLKKTEDTSVPENKSKTYAEYVDNAVAVARNILKTSNGSLENTVSGEEVKAEIETTDINMVINEDFSMITRNNKLNYTKTIWCLHKDCITSLETYNTQEELEKHMKECHN